MPPIDGLVVTIKATLSPWREEHSVSRRVWILDSPDEHGQTEHPAAVVYHGLLDPNSHWRACKPFQGGLLSRLAKVGEAPDKTMAMLQVDEWLGA